MNVVKETGNLPLPPPMRDSSYKGAAELGRGIGYKYAHDYEDHYVSQQYLPDGVKDERFYEPNEIGYEKNIKEYFRRIGKDPERYAQDSEVRKWHPWSREWL